MLAALSFEHPLDIAPRNDFHYNPSPRCAIKGENRSSLRPTSEGADCTWEVSSGRIGKSGQSLAEEAARAPGILTREMVLLQNFNFSGKVSGGYPRRDLELDVIPEQQLKGRRLT
jgi:hypothetical protein